jgi:mannose PTS system EIIA component
MIGVIVVTHGQLATELLNAAETIVGDLPGFAAVSIGWHDDVEQARAEIAETIARLEAADGVIILTDMFGGTPSNLAISVMDEAPVEVIAGINLPILVKLASVRSELPLAEAVASAREAGRKYIKVASQELSGES